MNNDLERHGVCSQHYHVQRLKTENGTVIDLRKFDAQMFPMDKNHAFMVATRHERILSGLILLSVVAGSSARMIKSIEYCISACDGERVVTQDFFHEFKRSVLLRQPEGLESWRLAPTQGPLFTLRPLNDILRVKSFGKINGAQFCC